MEKKYTADEFLKAAELGEVSMIDARHIVSLLDEVSQERCGCNMRYLITMNFIRPFFTQHFDHLYKFYDNPGMVVYDLVNGKYTTNGNEWQDIIIGNL